MDNVTNLLAWIGENEAVLSGVAAVIAITAVLLALSSRTAGMLRQRNDDLKPAASDAPANKLPQEIRYTRVADGLKIAWASAGSGYPLVRSLGWFTNLEKEWESPISSAFCQKLASRFQLIRYDGRGMGLSDRDVLEFTAETRLEDLEAVIEASGIERFALMGMSEGGSTAIKYAAKYPDRVSHLVLWGTFLATPGPDDVPQIAPSRAWSRSTGAAILQRFTRCLRQHSFPTGTRLKTNFLMNCSELQRPLKQPPPF